MEPERPRPAASEALVRVVREFLTLAGEDPAREGLARTPERVAESWGVLLAGMGRDPESLLEDAVFRDDSDQLVCVRDIELFSMCEHHLLPFVGRAHVAYVPDGRIIGFSRIPRLVDIFARRLQVQERLTAQVAETLERLLRPKGVGVVVEAEHLCMTMRGVEKQNAVAVTSVLRGTFRSDPSVRDEFFGALRRSPGR